MAPTLFSWRPKVIRIGRKTPQERQANNTTIATAGDPIIKPDPVPVALPPSSIPNNDYLRNAEIIKSSDNYNSDNYGLPSTPRTQRVRFSDG